MGGFVDGGDIGLILGIGIDFLIAYGFQYLYKHAVRAAVNIDNVKQYTINSKLQQKLEDSPDRTIPYACVEGVVRPVGATLKSQFKEGTEGVMQQSSLIEHKSRRVQGLWSDVKNVIRDNLEVIPFYLIPNGESAYPTKVMVTEPNSAYNIDQELSVTHENFTQPVTDLVKKSLELISGEVHKGLQETEKMLIVGTQLMAIGKLAKEGDEIKMKPPSPDYNYIISRKTKDELVRILQNKARMYKIVAWVLWGAGATLTCFLVYRVYRKVRKFKEIEKMKQDIQRQRDKEEQRRARTAHRSNSDSPSSSLGESQDWDSRKCVVCLNNQREVVLLNCGHVCLCGDCAFALPEPKKCPVCRERVEKFVTTYTP